MGKPHPIELRERVVAFVDEGHGHREAARHFRVSPRFVNIADPPFQSGIHERMSRPVCKGDFPGAFQSASTYPVSGSGPGQDGDARSPVLIIRAVSDDRSMFQGSVLPFDCQAIFLTTSRQKRPMGASPIRPPRSSVHRRLGRVERAPLAQHRPDDPRQLRCERDNHDIRVRALGKGPDPATERRLLVQ